MTREKKNFESMLSELEQIVTEMERDDLSLDDMLKHYSAGVKLADACKKRLQAVADVLKEKEMQ